MMLAQSTAPTDVEIEDIEISLLLEAIYRRYGYDFRDYARSSVARRLSQFLQDSGNTSYLDVAAQVLRDVDFFYRLIPYFSVSVTALFRDPAFYSALREKVIPLLRTWPNFKVWHAGCASGEEVYSMAILLREQSILDRAQFYATDISQTALDKAKAGIYSLDTVRKGSANYHSCGGDGSLSDHYRVRYNAALMDAELRRRITFAQHNLVTDKAFGEMQMVICRNVLIYFNEQLQERVLELIWESLDFGGFLCLGDKETLTFSPIAERFEAVDEKNHIYKKLVRAT
jgi:chemotaxis protein methyltransferase CheR